MWGAGRGGGLCCHALFLLFFGGRTFTTHVSCRVASNSLRCSNRVVNVGSDMTAVPPSVHCVAEKKGARNAVVYTIQLHPSSIPLLGAVWWKVKLIGTGSKCRSLQRELLGFELAVTQSPPKQAHCVCELLQFSHSHTHFCDHTFTHASRSVRNLSCDLLLLSHNSHTPQHTMSCAELPVELWKLIIGYVPIKDRLCSCNLVSSRLHAAAVAATASLRKQRHRGGRHLHTPN